MISTGYKSNKISGSKLKPETCFWGDDKIYLQSIFNPLFLPSVFLF